MNIVVQSTVSEHLVAMEDNKFWDKSGSEFDKDRHTVFLQMMYQLLPEPYLSQEINRLTLTYFIIVGLDILGSLHSVEKEAVVDWVLSLQYHPRDRLDLNNGEFYGFHVSRSSQFQVIDFGEKVPNGSPLASTYCALAIFKTIGFDLSLLNSNPILKSMRNLQQPDGRYINFDMYYIGSQEELQPEGK